MRLQLGSELRQLRLGKMFLQLEQPFALLPPEREARKAEDDGYPQQCVQQ